MSKALVILSGGQDSTTCLAWAKQVFEEVETITFDYGQRNSQEIKQAQKIAKHFNVDNTVIELGVINQLTENALTRKDRDIQHDGELPNTFVPGRNHLFISVAAIHAYEIGAKNIVVGVSETESSGYPDCSKHFIKSLNFTLVTAMNYNFEIFTPMMDKDKKQVWEMADELGQFDYIKNNTLTCYEGIIAEGCGQCPACKLRAKGLKSYEEVRSDGQRDGSK